MEYSARSIWFSGLALLVALSGCSSSSTSNGGSGTGGAGSITGGTGGNSSTGTGGSSNATTTQVTGSVCPGTFIGCGGDPTGTWKYSALCFEGDMTQAYNDYETEKYGAACANLIQSVTITIGGTVSINAGTYTYDSSSTNTQERVWTSACMAAMSGKATTMSELLCSNLQTAFSKDAGTAATCAFDGTNCTCVQSTTSTSSGTDTYTVSGNAVLWSNGTTSEFCVEGSSLTFQDPTDFGFNYSTTLQKQ